MNTQCRGQFPEEKKAEKELKKELKREQKKSGKQNDQIQNSTIEKMKKDGSLIF